MCLPQGMRLIICFIYTVYTNCLQLFIYVTSQTAPAQNIYKQFTFRKQNIPGNSIINIETSETSKMILSKESIFDHDKKRLENYMRIQQNNSVIIKSEPPITHLTNGLVHNIKTNSDLIKAY